MMIIIQQHMIWLKLQYALKNKKNVEVFDRYQYTSSDGQHQWVKKVIYKSKRDHIDTSMIEGCKSGYTSKAQSTLSSLLNINDHHYVLCCWLF